MRVRRIDATQEFLETAEHYLLADESRNNLVLGLADTLVHHPELYDGHDFWIVEDDNSIVGAALRTPPYNLVLAHIAVPAAARILGAELAGESLPGVVGLQPEVETFATAYSGRDGRRVMAQGVFALEQVESVSLPVGAARVAVHADKDILVRWLREFAAEALPPGSPGTQNLDRQIEARLASSDRGLWVWEAGGALVSLAGWGGGTPNGIRIGPVYTPPELRGHGYATALVATLSQHLLDQGRRFCFLYTDLSNPTSNAIYERIGYVRVAESAEIAFDD